ncbi:response regulator [Parvularcula flava]|uniref:Response regulator n=1 Tax=Aquisalinus luteolus TaxID=1566827 RepID=A0A8J3ETT9_9PROT|nr:response regulator [Aquisalinus luteolus]NHK27317.1 response regulator [Aquisalinus luteolus]GGH95069.1 hypothetical protein GCM10011355_10740 [Aquisalinus luteolus]
MVKQGLPHYEPDVSRRIAVLQIAFGVLLLLGYGAGLVFGTGLPVITAGSVGIVLFLVCAVAQYIRTPVSRAEVWAFAGLSILLFSFLIWSIALLYGGLVSAATGAPTFMFLFALLVLYGFHTDPKLVMFTGGVAVGARLAMDLTGLVAGGTFTTSYYWASSSRFITPMGELEILLALSVFTVLLSWLAGRWELKQARAVAAVREELEKRHTAAPSSADVTTILIAEDSSVNMMVLSNMLGDPRFNLVMTEDGAEAVKTFIRMVEEGGPPDVVLLDIEMPEMDGHEAAMLIRQAESDAGIDPRPIIAVTALGNEENRQASLAAGMDDHLVKPVQKPALLAGIAHALARRRRG